MTKYYLYIPFSNSENNAGLLAEAKEWSRNIAASANAAKTPAIVCHGANKFKATDDSSPIIYVLAHGINKELIAHCPYLAGKAWVCSTNSSQHKLISYLDMATIAQRIKEDGLTPQMNARIKLIFCNELNTAGEIANEFVEGLGDSFKLSKTRIDYFNAILRSPLPPLDKDTITLPTAYKIDEKSGQYVCIGTANSCRSTLSTYLGSFFRISQSLVPYIGGDCKTEVTGLDNIFNKKN